MSQPIIHVLVDFYYGDQQKWNYLYAWQGTAEQDACTTDTGDNE